MQQTPDQETINQLFNGNSQAFGNTTEQQYKAGTYKRGEVFLSKTSSLLGRQTATVLDYGCGTGRISMMLGKQGYQVLGVDPAVDHIEMAVQLNQQANVTFRVLTDAPIAPPSSFDAIVSSSVFEFVPDAQQYIQDISTLLKPGGCLIISFPNLWSLWRLYSKLRFGNTYKHFKFQKNLLSEKEINSLFSKHQFKQVGQPVYYESAFDHKGLGFLSSSKLFGTLVVFSFIKKG